MDICHKKLLKFLNEHRVNKGDPITHTSMNNPRGSFFISENDNDIFLELYQNAFFKDNKYSLIERHTDVSPILIDLDFKHEPDEDLNRFFTSKNIKDILQLYYEEIRKIFIIKEQSQLIAFVFTRDGPYIYNGVKRDGIHIIFPYIISEPNAQYYLRDCILKRITNEFDNLDLKNSISDVVDRSVIEKNGWFLYGSSKSNTTNYDLRVIYNCNLDEISNDEIDYQGFKNMAKFFSIRRHKKKDKINENVIESILKIGKKKIRKKKMSKLSTLDRGYDIKRIQELINILSDERSDNYNEWIEIGYALHNINPDDIELLRIWDEFSKKSSKYKEGDCENRWEKFKNEGYTIASIYYWGKKDNPDEFKKILRKDIQYYIEQSENSTNYDVAKVLHIMFEHNYVCASIKNKIWYEFKNHRWNKTETGHSLRTKISNELVFEYCQYISEINHLLTTEDLTDDEKDILIEKQKKFTNIVLRVKCTSFKNDIMKECVDLFYDAKFEEKLDENPYLLGFENGVYDLNLHEFRDGRPDDYIHMSTNINYIPLSENDEHIDHINLFLKQIQPDVEIREYLLLHLSSILEGINAREKFIIWTGTGGNGKSKLIETLLVSLGDYCVKFPITLLTGKRAKSNAATPEVMASKGKRFAYLEEPNEGEKINCGLMKEYTGGDKIKGRGLYKDFVEFKPQFKMVLLCNDLPEVPGHDQGVWRRMEVTEFKSKFVDNPKEPFEFKKDCRLSEKIRKWGENFMALLIEYHIKYKKYGIKIPEEVVKFTKEYQNTSDIHMGFFNEIVCTKNLKDKISYADMFAEYKLWCYEDNVKPFQKRELIKYVNKLFSKKWIMKTCLKGHQLNKDDCIVDSDID